MSSVHAQTYIISSSPSLPRNISERTWLPIADLLTEVTAADFVYEYPDNWPSYIKNMRSSKYHLLFDEPHLVSWRIENLQHIPLVKLTGTINFVVVTRASDYSILQLKELAGRPVCAQVPPLMDSLILFAQFKNPSRQPQLRRVRSAQVGYRELLDDGCRGAVLPLRFYEGLTRTERQAHVLFLSETFPNWALSADSAMSSTVRDQIRATILNPAHSALMRKLNNVFSNTDNIQAASTSEYLGYTYLLEDFWGFQ